MKKTGIIIIIQLAIIAVAFVSGNWFANRRNSVTIDPQLKTMTPDEKYGVLNKLSVEVQISYFDKHLGAPTYINRLDDGRKEYVYTDKDYFAQAVTDSHDKVISYAITSRNSNFNPSFERNGLFAVLLNKTPFSEWIIDGEFPDVCYRFLGAHDPLYYFEKIYFGNPGSYLTYLVGINNAAYPYEDIPEGDGSMESSWGKIDCKAVNKADRKRMAPNTLVVLGTDVREEDLHDPGVYFGPNNIQLRTLNE